LDCLRSGVLDRRLRRVGGAVMIGFRMKALFALVMFFAAIMLVPIVFVAAINGELLISAALAASGVVLVLLANVLVESMGKSS
jgi:hypothetical protein